MARGELLRKLFLGHQHGNDEEFRAAALEVVAEEEKKSNHHLAKDLLRILENSQGNKLNGPAMTSTAIGPPANAERKTLLVDVRQPDRHLDDILLDKKRRTVVERVLDEYRKSELLRVHGLRPSTRLLFCGPPGCGKTLCSEVISGELGIPLLYTRFDAIISSYLGETAANLRKVFDYASSGRWVVLFDEFDAIGKARDDAGDHGELKRVVNSFLQLLDSFSAPSIVIAATNHEQLLDPALWRRFDEVLLFPRPSDREIQELLEKKLRNFPHHNLSLSTIAGTLKGMSHADVERICFDAVKASILSDQGSVSPERFGQAVAEHKSRIAISVAARKRRRQ